MLVKSRAKYTKELLEPIVKASRSYSDVMRALGLAPNGGNHRMISALIRRFGLSTDHFDWSRQFRRYSQEQLEPLVKTSRSISEVMKKLGVNVDNGGRRRFLMQRISELGISTAHFRGQGWARGETVDTDVAIRRITNLRSLPPNEVFVVNSPVYVNWRLVPRLLRMGWKYECSQCGIKEWQGRPLRLHLDHINGIHSDNRLENLRFLCPNCHSQTDTYCGKKKRRK